MSTSHIKILYNNDIAIMILENKIMYWPMYGDDSNQVVRGDGSDDCMEYRVGIRRQGSPLIYHDLTIVHKPLKQVS